MGDRTNKQCYSSLKVFHHRDKIDALRAGEHPSPVHVHLVPTNRCNQNCQMCAYRSEGYSSSQDFHAGDEIPNERLISLASELKAAGVKAVELTGGGEPTVHRKFPSLCLSLASHGVDYGVVTNGAVVSDECLDALSGAKWVRFSIDAGSRETYGKTRRVKAEFYEQARCNLRSLVQQRLCRTSPLVGVGFVVTEDNWGELLHAAQQAKEDGADNIRISAVFQNDGAEYFRRFFSGIRNLCRQAKKLEDDSFHVFDLFGERVEDLQQASPDYSYCGVQRMVCYIGADMNVYRCCVLSYNQRGLLGSIKDRTFGEFWNDPATRKKMDDFDASECVRCMFNAKNRTIAYATSTDPDHVNFL